MKKILPVLFFTVPFLSFGQNINSIVKKELSEQYAPATNGSLFKILDAEYYLTGTRKDTFSSTTSAWGVKDSSRLLYDVIDTLVTVKYDLINDPDSGWVNNLGTFYNYDINDNLILTQIQSFDVQNVAWTNVSQLANSYDGSNHLLTTTIDNWNTSSSAWDHVSQIANTYDGNGNKTHQYILGWNGASWDSLNEFEYSYDGNNNQTQEVDYNYIGSWSAANKYLNTFNGANYKIQVIGQYKQGNNWKNQFRDTLIYDLNNNETSFERLDWENSSSSFSLTDAKSEFAYNGSNELTQREDYNGDGASAFTPSAQYTFDYDANDNQVHQLQQVYDAGSSTFKNYAQYFYYYDTELPNAITAVPVNSMQVTLFPNPAGGNVQLSLAANQTANVQVEVFNMAGEQLIEFPFTLKSGTNLIQLNTALLQKGFYQVRIVNEQTKAQSTNSLVIQ